MREMERNSSGAPTSTARYVQRSADPMHRADFLSRCDGYLIRCFTNGEHGFGLNLMSGNYEFASFSIRRRRNSGFGTADRFRRMGVFLVFALLKPGQ